MPVQDAQLAQRGPQPAGRGAVSQGPSAPQSRGSASSSTARAAASRSTAMSASAANREGGRGAGAPAHRATPARRRLAYRPLARAASAGAGSAHCTTSPASVPAEASSRRPRPAASVPRAAPATGPSFGRRPARGSRWPCSRSRARNRSDAARAADGGPAAACQPRVRRVGRRSAQRGQPRRAAEPAWLRPGGARAVIHHQDVPHTRLGPVPPGQQVDQPLDKRVDRSRVHRVLGVDVRQRGQLLQRASRTKRCTRRADGSRCNARHRTGRSSCVVDRCRGHPAGAGARRDPATGAAPVPRAAPGSRAGTRSSQGPRAQQDASAVGARGGAARGARRPWGASRPAPCRRRGRAASAGPALRAPPGPNGTAAARARGRAESTPRPGAAKPRPRA